MVGDYGTQILIYKKTIEFFCYYVNEIVEI